MYCGRVGNGKKLRHVSVKFSRENNNGASHALLAGCCGRNDPGSERREKRSIVHSALLADHGAYGDSLESELAKYVPKAVRILGTPICEHARVMFSQRQGNSHNEAYNERTVICDDFRNVFDYRV